MINHKEQESFRKQEVRLQCIDYATRIVEKPYYIQNGNNGTIEKHQESVIDVAKQMYDFVMEENQPAV